MDDENVPLGYLPSSIIIEPAIHISDEKIILIFASDEIIYKVKR